MTYVQCNTVTLSWLVVRTKVEIQNSNPKRNFVNVTYDESTGLVTTMQQLKKLMKDTVGCIMSWHSTKGGHAVVQLFEALRYKPEGHGFDS